MLGLAAILLSSVVSASAAGAATIYLLRHKRIEPGGKALDDRDAYFLFRGTELQNTSGEGEWLFEISEKGGTDWNRLHGVLASRFKDFPENPEQLDSDIVTFRGADKNDLAELLVERIGDLTRVSLFQAANAPRYPTQTDRGIANNDRLELLENAMDASPYPVWSTDENGMITWANHAYEFLAENIETQARSGIPTLFPSLPTTPPASPRARMSLTLKESESNIWFDVTTVETQTGRMNYATDINAVVQAEIAQRNFVQTLTKTFAQLSTGLVIFDRKRQLALFNPALIDLLRLSPEYLSARPTLLSFFDKLRDHQIMPEPKSYRTWRESMAELIEAASDGSYQETWSLPSGLTYRVSGRPHPDGAVAFLFEDISSEVSLTRRFRTQLDVLQSVVDKVPQALAVFSPSGVMTFANTAYRNLWGCDPDTSIGQLTFDDARRNWQAKCEKSTDLPAIQLQSSIPVELRLISGRQVTCIAQMVSGGSYVVVFTQVETASRTPALESIA